MAYTTINKPENYFKSVLYTGTHSSVPTVTVGFKSDFLWLKSRTQTYDHNLFNTTRGGTKKVFSNNNNVESTTGDSVTFNATTFQPSGQAINESGQGDNNMVSWSWLANGTAPTKTYKVVVVSDSGNKYRFRNSADNATYAASAVTLNLQEGGTYTFDVSDNTVDSHPFVIGTSANSNEYSTGVVYKLDGVTKTYSQYTSGFSAATTRQLIITVAASAPTLYYWCSVHSGMGGQINTNTTSGSTNFDGTGLAIVNASSASGFSIIDFTASGASGQTVGHGLSSTPTLTIRKSLGSTADWFVHTTQIDGSMDYLKLNTNVAKADSSLSAPTATTIGADANTNNYIAYCFAEIKGYSKFGSYNGNGNADGTFVYTGFKPAFLLTKRADYADNWRLVDSTRNPGNDGSATCLLPNANNNETNSGARGLDLLSNGFKVRTTDPDSNSSDAGSTYFYMAFADKTLVATNDIIGLAR